MGQGASLGYVAFHSVFASLEGHGDRRQLARVPISRHTPRKRYPLRRGFSAQSRTLVEYWITRFRACDDNSLCSARVRHKLLWLHFSNSSRVVRQTQLRDLAAHFARVLLKCRSLRNQRAQGMPGARCARSRACSVESTRVSHHGHTGNTRHSPRNGFNGFLRALPGDRACLPPSSAELLPPT